MRVLARVAPAVVVVAVCHESTSDELAGRREASEAGQCVCVCFQALKPPRLLCAGLPKIGRGHKARSCCERTVWRELRAQGASVQRTAGGVATKLQVALSVLHECCTNGPGNLQG